MGKIYFQAAWTGILGLLFFFTLVFLPAGTLYYWQGWAFIAVFTASTVGFTVYLARYDKPLLERRMKAGPWQEKETSQKIIVSLIILGFFALIILPALDYRYGLSPVPAYASIIGDALMVFSFLFIFWVINANSFAAANISIAEGQKVISDGPYAYARHPMYAGMFALLVGIPLALGSWYSLLFIILYIPVIIWRLMDEERILHRDLPGYTAYTEKVRSRLIPGVW